MPIVQATGGQTCCSHSRGLAYTTNVSQIVQTLVGNLRLHSDGLSIKFDMEYCSVKSASIGQL